MGVSYGDYLEQLTYLLFLKMADEYGKPPYNRDADFFSTARELLESADGLFFL